MFERILLAVDGSDESLRAARVAGHLAAATGASIRLLTIHEEPSTVRGEPDYSDFLARELAEADRSLAAAAAEIAAAGGPTPDQGRQGGDPVEAVLTAASVGAHDLIVLGNRGRGRIAGAVLGSVSTAVASRATVPVLIVPHLAA